MHPGMIRVNNQLDAQLSMYVYFYSHKHTRKTVRQVGYLQGLNNTFIQVHLFIMLVESCRSPSVLRFSVT